MNSPLNGLSGRFNSSPFNSFNSRSNHALAIAYFYTQRYGDAADAARSAIDANPGFSIPRAVLAAALMQLGRVEEAKAAAQAVLESDLLHHS